MKALIWARRLAWGAPILIAFLIGVAIYYSEFAIDFVRTHEQIFKLVGLGIGPLIAVLGFFWGLVDKAELKHLTGDLERTREQAKGAQQEADAARAEFDAKEARIQALQTNLAAVADAGRLWKLRPNAPFPEFRGWKYDPRGAKIVTFALFKGGVGKSHLSANFAAYVSETQKKPVLLVDLDYQGSLSTFVVKAAGAQPVGSAVDALFAENANLATLHANTIHLAPNGPQTILNKGRGLSRAWLVPADYTLAEVESRLLIERVVNNSAELDERYRLAHVLLHPHVRDAFSMIILDTPPRMTLGTVNAFVASHFYVLPTILDRISSEAVRPFLTQVEALKKDLDLDTALAGIVAMMTREMGLSETTELPILKQVGEAAAEILKTNKDFLVPQNVPRKKQITDSEDLGYFLSDTEGPLKDRFYDAVFNELWDRIMKPESQ